MSTELSTVTPNMQLVALTPAELPEQQAKLSDWCHAKMRELGQEYRELSANLAIAKKNRWSRGGLIRAVSRTKQRIQYYRKIRTAVQAGYLIIPNFPIELIAVRVSYDKDGPRSKVGRWASDVNKVSTDLLPAGEGRYVDEIAFTHEITLPEKQGEKWIDVKRQRTGDYDTEVDFPVVGVRPMIMEATSQAMKSLIFDRIGIANHSGRTQSSGQRRADPIVIGQILDPKGGGAESWRVKPVSFFIAWWLDTSVL